MSSKYDFTPSIKDHMNWFRRWIKTGAILRRFVLGVERLEDRDNPSSVFDPSAWSPSFQPIPGFTGTVYQTEGDYQGTGAIDYAFVAGAGGSIHVVVYAGLIPGQFAPGAQGALNQPSSPTILFNEILDDTQDSPIGGNVATLNTSPAILVVAPLAGGGPVASFINLESGSVHSVFIGDPNYRGGVNLNDGDVVEPIGGYINQDLIVTPTQGGGGGPVISAFDANGDLLAGPILVGPADDRSGDYQPRNAGEAVYNGVWVVDINGPNGSVVPWSWSGVDESPVQFGSI
jgi:hypothetical protein